MLKKVSGDASGPSEIFEARVDYRLFAVGDPARPAFTESVKASSGGGFGIRSALRLAAFAGQMYLTMGMGGGMMMGMMGQGSASAGIGGPSGGVMTGRMNPGIGAAMSIMSAGPGWEWQAERQEWRACRTRRPSRPSRTSWRKATRYVTDALKKRKPAAGGASKH